MAVQVLTQSIYVALPLCQAPPKHFTGCGGWPGEAGSGPAPAHLLICDDLGSSALDLSSLN